MINIENVWSYDIEELTEAIYKFENILIEAHPLADVDILINYLVGEFETHNFKVQKIYSAEEVVLYNDNVKRIYLSGQKLSISGYIRNNIYVHKLSLLDDFKLYDYVFKTLHVHRDQVLNYAVEDIVNKSCGLFGVANTLMAHYLNNESLELPDLDLSLEEKVLLKLIIKFNLNYLPESVSNIANGLEAKLYINLTGNQVKINKLAKLIRYIKIDDHVITDHLSEWIERDDDIFAILYRVLTNKKLEAEVVKFDIPKLSPLIHFAISNTLSTESLREHLIEHCLYAKEYGYEIRKEILSSLSNESLDIRVQVSLAILAYIKGRDDLLSFMHTSSEGYKFYRGLKERRAGNIDESLKIFNHLKRCSNSSFFIGELNNALGLNYLQLNDFDQAEYYFDQAILSEGYAKYEFKKNVSLFNKMITLENNGLIPSMNKALYELNNSDMAPSLSLSFTMYKSYRELKMRQFQTVITRVDTELAVKEPTPTQLVLLLDYKVESLIGLKRYSDAGIVNSHMLNILNNQDLSHFEIKSWRNQKLIELRSRGAVELEPLEKKTNGITKKYLIDVFRVYGELALRNEDYDKLWMICAEIEKLFEHKADPYFEFDNRYWKYEIYKHRGEIEKAAQVLGDHYQYGLSHNIHDHIENKDNLFQVYLDSGKVQELYDLLGHNFKHVDLKQTNFSLGHWAVVKTLLASKLQRKNEFDNGLRFLKRYISYCGQETVDAKVLFFFNFLNYLENFGFEYKKFILLESERADVQNLLDKLDFHVPYMIKQTKRSQVDEIALIDYLEELHRNKLEANNYLIDDIRKEILLSGEVVISNKKSSVLYKLLRALAKESKGFVSKDELINHVWNETYDPLRHDNTLSNALFRLKTVLKHEKPAYIKDNNIYLSKDIKMALYTINRLSDIQINKRQRWCLEYAKYNGKINNSTYGKMQSVSARTALRDLQGLVQVGLLEKKGRGKALHYTLTQ